MFVEDLRNEFYNVLVGKKLLIMVNYDIDGICAIKILQSLFRYDHVLYSLVPVLGVASMRRAFEIHKDSIKYVLLINCGGCIDIVEVLQPEDDVTFFVCDSHRPLDVCNIYSDRQVRVLREGQEEELAIPPFEQIFRESDDEDSENELENDRETQLRKLSERRSWEENRDRIMFNYMQYTFYGRCSSLIMFELAWKMSRDSIDILWWAIVGATEQFVMGKIESSTHLLEKSNLQRHISRIAVKSDQSNQTTAHIALENDLCLSLYRHWSVFESLRYTVYTSCELKLWSTRGEKKLLEFLADVGLPLDQAKQLFRSMEISLRRELKQSAEKAAAKYGLSDITVTAFILKYGYSIGFAASDYVYSLTATLACSENQKPEDRFLRALDSLNRKNKPLLIDGIEKAKTLMTTIGKQVQICLDLNQVNLSGSFLYVVLSEENRFLFHPYSALMFGRCLLSSYVSVSRSRKANELPLLLSCVIDAKAEVCLLVGIPPLKETCSKNFLGRAFQQAAIRSGSSILSDFFETSIIQITQTHLPKFLDALSVLIK